MTRRIRRSALGLAVLAAAVAPSFAQPLEAPVRFTSIMIDQERGGANRLDFTVQRWSTDAEQKQLVSVEADKGQQALLDTVQRARRVGFIQTFQGLGWDIRYAWREAAQDGGEHVMIITDRPLSLFEAWNRPRSTDYPFTVIQLQLKDGEGEGLMSLATRITADKVNALLILENLEYQRIQLREVRARSQRR